MPKFELLGIAEDGDSGTWTIEAADRIAAIEVLAAQEPDYTVPGLDAVTQIED